MAPAGRSDLSTPSALCSQEKMLHSSYQISPGQGRQTARIERGLPSATGSSPQRNLASSNRPVFSTAMSAEVVLTLVILSMSYVAGLGLVTASDRLPYRVECPVSCVCAPSGVLPSQTVAHVNCSGQGLSWYSLQVSPVSNSEPSLSNSSTGLDDPDGNNGTSPVITIDLTLQSLDLSHNRLTSAAANITGADGEDTAVTVLLSVDTLDVSHNMLEAIPAGSFDSYAQLTSLDLSHNQIHSVSRGAFAGMVGLVTLDLAHNSLSDMNSSVFESLVSLESLDLSHNLIQTLDALHALSSLKYLYLQHNNIIPVKEGSPPLLPPQAGLVVLDLSCNPLGTTGAGMFEGLPRLASLDISACSIAELDRHFLRGLTLLRGLRLDSNNLTSVSGPVFQNTSLTSLSVASMPSLVNISHDAFLGLSRLTSLNLSHNTALTFVHPQLLSPLPQLRTLDLSHCGVSLLSHTTFLHSPSLESVYLASNPLACSCVNAWLEEEAATNSSSRFPDSSSLKCLNSSSGQTQPAVPASFPCEEVSLHHNSTSRVVVRLGARLRLKCGHTSVQPALVSWTTPGGEVLLLHPFHPEASSHLLSPADVEPGTAYHEGHYWHGSSSYYPDLSHRKDRLLILSDGSLYIDYMLRTDTGPYVCRVGNARYNQSTTVSLYLNYEISGDVKIFAIIVGLLCALAFFTLNIIYVIISWIARRLVNKRRREIIRQMLENMNAYKSAQITRIHENYTHQLGRVRNQYHTQRDRLHRNYTQQVARMKRGCSNQVDRARDNHTSRLAQLREYSSSQIVQIRERANNQIVRIRDYGTAQLEKLRETYKLQHLHVMKLLDTMNLDNCRHMVETECMRAESMMFDVDLLAEEDRTDSPLSAADSEYTTPDSSPAPSLEEKAAGGGSLAQDMAAQEADAGGGGGHPRKKILHPVKNDNSRILMEMQTTFSIEDGLALDVTDQWDYNGGGTLKPTDQRSSSSPHRYHTNVYVPGKSTGESLRQFQSEPEMYDAGDDVWGEHTKESFPLPVLSIEDEDDSTAGTDLPHEEQEWGSPYVTPEASPTKRLRTPPHKSNQKDFSKGSGHNSETDL